MPSAIKPHGYLKKLLSHDEEVLVLTRQHWLLLIVRIFLSVLLFTVMAALAVWAELERNFSPQWAYLYLLMLPPLFHIFWKILVWENHMYVITNRRVAQLSGVFNKEVVDSVLEKVNDVKTDQTLLGRIFGYGDLQVLTASEAGQNEFHHIAAPLEFKNAMQDAREALDRDKHSA